MSSFKPLSFDKPVSINDYPKADDKFIIPNFIRESFVDAERDRQEFRKKVDEQAEQKIEALVETIKKQAYEEGFEQGRKDAIAQMEDDRIKTMENFKDQLQGVLSDLNDQKIHLLDQNINFFYQLIGEICKKVVSSYIEFDKESLGKWLVQICDELSQSEELTIHTNEEYNQVLQTSITYLRQQRTKFPNIKFVVDQDKPTIIVESKKVDIIADFNEQINSIVKLIEK